MYTVNLLPNYYKKIGGGILLATALVPILSLAISYVWTHRVIIKPFLVSGMLMGLLIIAMAKEKVEDELIMNLRLKALAGAAIVGCIYVIINPFIHVLFGDPANNGSIGSLFSTIALWYHVNFYLFKRSR